MTRVGSVQWAAPEVLLGQSYSHKCDLWSFGVVCWELFTAKVPFDGMQRNELARKVAVEGLRLPPPPALPRRLLRLMATCFGKPSKRPEFAHVLAELHAAASAIESASASPSPSPVPPFVFQGPAQSLSPVPQSPTASPTPGCSSPRASPAPIGPSPLGSPGASPFLGHQDPTAFRLSPVQSLPVQCQVPLDENS